MSKADSIAAAVVNRLKTISLANGFGTDAGLNVYRGSLAIDPAKLPSTTLIEQEDQVEAQRVDDRADAAGTIDTDVLLPFVIETTGPCDPDNPNVAGHAFVRDIKRAVFGGDLTWGGLATHTRYVGRTIGPRADGTNLVTVTVQIRVGCVENLANP
ncbi:MAG: hypothetical protein AzoDbin1_02160 [Azoarcus sp.]|nr:hypothetical protein [Azoarcus sp.]